MNEAFICSPVRTPVGRFGGSLAGLKAHELGAQVVSALVERSGIDPERIEDVVFGQCYPNGSAPAIGRVIALDAGLPPSVPGLQVDRRCGSGLQAVLDAAMRIQTGVADLVVAGGAESMSNVEHFTTDVRWGKKAGNVVLEDRLSAARVSAGGRFFPIPGGMLETAENLRRKYGISREEQDELAVASHERACAAQDSGAFSDEIVPVRVPGRDELVEVDEHPRRGVTVESLSKLKAVMAREDDGATVTAGNASGQNDAAAACIVASMDAVHKYSLTPLLRLVSWGVSGVDPRLMGVGPVPASAIALEKAGLTLSDMDLIEVNEAFAVQVIAVIREWAFCSADYERLNVCGSGIALGHAVGSTGARILATMANEMLRRKARYGLETMCIGGGQGLAAVFERVD